MALGVPVAGSDCSALPEVVGDAPLLFDLRRPEEFARTIVDLVSDQPTRSRLIRAGTVRGRTMDGDGLRGT
jgi:glycosyltransferase involved in cell wall biosynthesis